MLRMLCPNVYLESIYELDLEKLKKKGIKGIITDLDNTLISWGEEAIYPSLDEWFEKLKEEGFKICLVSNNSLGRVSLFSERFDIPAVPKAAKPRRRPFRQALKHLEMEPAEAAVLGDQVFTDVLGGNRMGLFTILVIPVSSREFFGTRIVRQAERFVLKSLKKRGMLSS